MQPNAEHEEDDADLGEVIGEALIGDKARCEGSDQDASDQVSYQGRDAQAVGKSAENKRQHQAHHDRRDQGGVMRHSCVPFAFASHYRRRPLAIGPRRH